MQTSTPGAFTLSLYTNVGLTDSRHAHNPWLQELPDPVTKVTWDNYVCMSEATAGEQQIVGRRHGTRVGIQRNERSNYRR